MFACGISTPHFARFCRRHVTQCVLCHTARQRRRCTARNRALLSAAQLVPVCATARAQLRVVARSRFCSQCVAIKAVVSEPDTVGLCIVVRAPPPTGAALRVGPGCVRGAARGRGVQGRGLACRGRRIRGGIEEGGMGGRRWGSSDRLGSTRFSSRTPSVFLKGKFPFFSTTPSVFLSIFRGKLR